VAITPRERDDNRRPRKDGRERVDCNEVYVGNMESITVPMMGADKRRGIRTCKVGAEPFGCAARHGERLSVETEMAPFRIELREST
jgi:hypothetical protein